MSNTPTRLLSPLRDEAFLREHLGHLNHNELLVAQATVQVVIEQMLSQGLTIIPVQPSPGLLMSMAVRSDHGLGCPEYYDQPLLGGKPGAHARRLEATLRSMGQLHEEVVGTGFHRPENEQRYLDMLAQAAPGEDVKGASAAS